MENQPTSMRFEGEATFSSLNEFEGGSEISSEPGGIGEMIDSSFDNLPEPPTFIESMFSEDNEDEQGTTEVDEKSESRGEDEGSEKDGIENLFEGVEELEEKSEESEVGLNEIEAIREQIERLTNENVELHEKFNRVDERMDQLAETSYQMAMLLKRLTERELDEKRKKSMIEILFKIIGDIMRQMMVPDEAQREVEKRAA